MTLLRGLFQNTCSRATQLVFHLSTAPVLVLQIIFLLSLNSCLRIVISLAVAIGSIISQVPAESCNEIKMSEKGRNGKYWLSSIIPGAPVFAYCDMSTGGWL